MNQNVKRSVIALLERAGSVAQAGSRAAAEEMMALNQECGGIIPGWYIELVTTYPLCGLELGWQSSAPDEDNDGVSWMHWSDPAGMRREMLEYYPGAVTLTWPAVATAPGTRILFARGTKMTPRSSKWPMTCPMTLSLSCEMGYSWSPEGSRSYSLTHSWALPERAKHNNGIHPTPHHGF